MTEDPKWAELTGFSGAGGIHNYQKMTRTIHIRRVEPTNHGTLASIFLESRRRAYHWRNPAEMKLEDFEAHPRIRGCDPNELTPEEVDARQNSPFLV